MVRVFVSGAEYDTAKIQGGIDFARQQREFGKFRAKKVAEKIAKREAELISEGYRDEHMDQDDVLMDLYDEEMYLARFITEMKEREDYLREKHRIELKEQNEAFLKNRKDER